MSTVVMSAKECSSNVKNNTKSLCEEIKKTFNVTPTLAVVVVGDDPASKVYVRNKSKACDYIGANFEEITLPSDSKLDDILPVIQNLNQAPHIHGILVQCPIGNLSHSQTLEVFKAIDPKKDVDGFTPLNRARLLTNSYEWYPYPCTPMGIYLLLNFYGISVSEKHVTIIGRSNIVGKPLACLLENNDATVTLCHSKTNLWDIKDFCANSDIIISAVGIPKFIDNEFVARNAFTRPKVVIDVGMNKDENGKLCGDVDFDKVKEVFDDYAEKEKYYITPVPGGVGLMTVSCLMYNLVKCCERICENER